MRRPRVLLADEQRLFREAFESLLQPMCNVVGSFADGRELLAKASELKPDLILMDSAIPPLNGLDACRQIKRILPDVRIIFVTLSEDADLPAAAFRAGASAFLLKQSGSTELFQAIREVASGHSYVTPLATRGMLGALMRKNEAADPPEPLSPRRREVLQLLAEGRSMKEVACILKISSRTVAFHKYGMMQLLGIRSSAELVRYAVKEQLVPG